MIKYRVRGVALLHFVLTAMAAVGIFWLWVGLYFVVWRSQDPVSYKSYLLYSGLVVIGLCANHAGSKFPKFDLLQIDFVGALRLSIRQLFMILGAIVLYLFASKDSAMSRVFLFTLLPILAVALVEINAKLPRFLASRMFHRRRRQRTVLLGTHAQAVAITEWLRNKSPYGLDIIGIVTDERGNEDESSSWPVIGRPVDLEEVLQATGATQVIALQLPNSIARAARLNQTCESRGVRLMFVNDVEQRFSRSVQFFDEGGVRFLTLREEPLECPFNRVLKRMLDVAVSLPVVLFVLPPITLVVYIVHRLQSPGPLFFKQMRTGFQFEPFEIIKYRTMHVAKSDESVQATADDQRVFSFGRWLRRLSIDELPQFINVLRGDMSVVGPRPHMAEHDSRFQQAAKLYRMRSLVRPGITGLAQVAGFRGETRHAKDVVDRVKSDVYYLENWSIALDWAIMVRTGWQMFRPLKTAY
jgi:exopolysaccharide biosynthesis polyprenyl glycosylphosphotransferase